MVVYNIRKTKYAKSLTASGVANRWNKNDEFVVYTGGSIALSTLELVAHRNTIDIRSGYSLLFITLNIDQNDIIEINRKELQDNWKSIESYPNLQKMGSAWYQSKKSLVLKVPSAIVHWESNYLINMHHPDFEEKVHLTRLEDFIWDHRLISTP